MAGNPHETQVQLDRMNWMADQGPFSPVSMFQVDVYRFRIRTDMDRETNRAFVEYVHGLDMTQRMSIAKVWIWLYQRGLDFRLKFGYNRRKSPAYNLKFIIWPYMIDWTMRQCSHYDLMACPLDEVDRMLEQYGPDGAR